MKRYVLCVVAGLLTACAHGATGPHDDGLGGGDATTSSSSDSSSSAVSSSSSSSSTSGMGGSAPVDPYLETNDQAIVYSLDSDVWEIMGFNYDPNATIHATYPCFHDMGTMDVDAQLQANNTGQVLIDYRIDFRGCTIPTGWELMLFRFDGVVKVTGLEYGNNGGNYLDLDASELRIQGAVGYEGGHVELIDELCHVKVHDNFDESFGDFGGLTGTVCDHPEVYVAEVDPNP